MPSVLAVQSRKLCSGLVGRSTRRSAAAMPERLTCGLAWRSFAGNDRAYLVKELVDGALALRLTLMPVGLLACLIRGIADAPRH